MLLKESTMEIVDKLKEKKGVLFPISVLIMLIAGVSVYNIGLFAMNKMYQGQNNNLSFVARQEAENALVYGIYGSETDIADGGHKCQKTGWYDHSSHGTEITNEDGGAKTTKDGYIIRRYISFAGTSNNHDAIMTGIARIYSDNGNKLVKEAKVQMNVNLLFNGTPAGAPDLCSAKSVQMKKETWRVIQS